MKFTSCLLVCVFAIPAINASYPISAFKNGMLQVFPPGIDGQLYGYPDDKIGGMIIEGPFPYLGLPNIDLETTRGLLDSTSLDSSNREG